MYIIVGGGGMVGGQIARRLMKNNHDVVVIEEHKQVCDRIYAETGVIAITGSISRTDVLVEAGINKADLIVAATGSDADNLACSILAKSFDVPRVIVRMRNPDYEKAYRLAGVNSIVRVTDLMVNQLVVDIENPELKSIATIGHGKANIFMVEVPAGAKVAGKTICEVTKCKKFPVQSVFVALYNHLENKFSIPRGDHVIEEGDEIYLAATSENIKTAADYLRATSRKESTQLVGVKMG